MDRLNFNKFIYAFYFLLSSSLASAFALPQAFHSPSLSEITVSDLNWIDLTNLPKEIPQSKDYRTWLKDMGEAPPLWFSEINVDDDEKTREILIASSYSGSGGRNFLLMIQTKNGQWNELVKIFGAPIFLKLNSTGFAELQTYHRNAGDLWQQSFKYQNGKYKRYAINLMPRAIVTECFYQRWLRLNLLNANPIVRCGKE